MRTHQKLIKLELIHELLKLNEITQVRYKLSLFNLINYRIFSNKNIISTTTTIIIIITIITKYMIHTYRANL